MVSFEEMKKDIDANFNKSNKNLYKLVKIPTVAALAENREISKKAKS